MLTERDSSSSSSPEPSAGAGRRVARSPPAMRWAAALASRTGRASRRPSHTAMPAPSTRVTAAATTNHVVAVERSVLAVAVTTATAVELATGLRRRRPHEVAVGAARRAARPAARRGRGRPRSTPSGSCPDSRPAGPIATNSMPSTRSARRSWRSTRRATASWRAPPASATTTAVPATDCACSRSRSSVLARACHWARPTVTAPATSSVTSDRGAEREDDAAGHVRAPGQSRR